MLPRQRQPLLDGAIQASYPSKLQILPFLSPKLTSCSQHVVGNHLRGQSIIVAAVEQDEEAWQRQRQRYAVTKKGQPPPGGGAIQVTSRDLPETKELAIRQASQALSCYVAGKVQSDKQVRKGFASRTQSGKREAVLPKLLQLYIPVQLNTPQANCQLVADVLKQLDISRIAEAPVFMSNNDARDLARLKPYNLYAFALSEAKDYNFQGEAVIVEPDEDQAGAVLDLVNGRQWRTLIVINPGWGDNRAKGRELLELFTEGLMGKGTFFMYRWCDGEDPDDYKYRIFKLEKDNTTKLVSEYNGRPSSKELTDSIEVTLAVNSPLSKAPRAIKKLFTGQN